MIMSNFQKATHNIVRLQLMSIRNYYNEIIEGNLLAITLAPVGVKIKSV